jgi:hypothetical protein
MKEQDFSKKAVVAVRRDIESWQVLNTIAHAAAYLGNKLGERFDTGEYFTTKDGINHPRNSQYGIVVLEGNEADLRILSAEARKRDLLHIEFIRDMIGHIDDAELEGEVAKKVDAELEYLGVGVFGDKTILKEITSKFKLWK